MKESGTPLERAVAIVSLLSGHPDGCTRSEISGALALPQPTVHRLTRNLAELDLIRSVGADGRLGLGPALIRWGMAALDGLDLRRVARPHLARLVALTAETVHLGILDGTTVTYLDRVESPQPVRMASRMGGTMPTHSTALGKAMLAAGLADVIDGHLTKVLDARTPHTITDRAAFLRDLSQCRTRGYAVDLEENELGVVCVAAAIRDHAASVVAAISLSVPKFRLQSIDSLASCVRQAAREVSLELGCSETALAVGIAG